MTSDNFKKEIIKTHLNEKFPNPSPPLNYETPFQFLIAVILSAQTTDIAVNKVTKKLFEAYPNASSLADADIRDIENKINKLGLYKSKAKYIKQTARMIRDEYNNNVPETLKDLTKLAGVGPKTAKVVLGQAFELNGGFAVDTHVMRLSRKWGLTQNKDAEKIAKDLENFFENEKSEWAKLSLQIIFWGRQYCPARIKKEDECIICTEIQDVNT